MSTAQFINSISIKEILEKPLPEGKLLKEIRTKYERIRLVNFVSTQLSKFIKYSEDQAGMFDELVGELVDSRLRLKSFKSGQSIMDEREEEGADEAEEREGAEMDCICIILNGRVSVVAKDTGQEINHYCANEIIAKSGLGVHDLAIKNNFKK